MVLNPAHRRARAPLIFLYLTLAGTRLIATILNNSTGFPGPHATITCSEVSLPDNTPVTNEFVDFGATFSGAFDRSAGADGYPNFSGDRLANFSSGIVTIAFNVPVSAAAFAVVGNGPPPTAFVAFRGGVQVGSFSKSLSSSDRVNFVGFTDETFESIEIAPKACGSVCRYRQFAVCSDA